MPVRKREDERLGRRSPSRPALARISPWRRRLALAVVITAFPLLAWMYLVYDESRDSAITYSSIEEHLKYGSTGSERTVGAPYAVFQVLPRLFADYLPGDGYASLGFIYERDHDLPVGFSLRRVGGLDRVGLNCGACHVGQVRDTAGAEPRLYVGMPGNTVDIGAFQQFLFRCAADSRFTPERILAEIDAAGIWISPIERARLRYFEIYRLREMLLMLRQRFEFMEDHPQFGPGRIDTITATKALFDMDLGDPYVRPVGTVDFAAVWMQGKKSGMSLYWDGSNDSMEERHMLGAVHTGAVEQVDGFSVSRARKFFENEAPPPYPYGFDAALSDRGKQIFGQYCADCHGDSGREFGAGKVGRVTPLGEIGTDSNRLRVYTEDVAASQRDITAGGKGFEHFKKTDGYSNLPLDGLWLRAPYLHNGSVPTVKDLLEPASERPKVFYRGGDLYDRASIGFVSDQPEQSGRKLFKYYTGLPGNSNRGHEGFRYGTELNSFEKSALLEYLKTF